MMFDVHTSLRGAALHLRYLAFTWLGLTLAFASAVLIGAYTWHELDYERWIPEFERVVVVESRVATPGRASERMIASQLLLTPNLAQPLASVAHVARVWEQEADLAPGVDWLSRPLLFTDADIVDVFGLRSLSGDARAALATSSALVLSRDVAEAWFGSAHAALGRRVRMRLDGRTASFTVGAVIDQPAGPSHLDFGALARLERGVIDAPHVFDNWASFAGRSYMRLRADADRGAIERALEEVAAQGLRAQYGAAAPLSVHYALLPVASLHIGGQDRLIDREANAADEVFVYGLAGVGLMIATLASANYAALNTAFASRRAREIALRRVVGATPASIVWNMFAEAVVIVLAALAAALLLAFAILPLANAQLGFTLSLAPLLAPVSVVGLAGFALALGALAGALPALSLANADCARVLAGGGASARLRAGRQRFVVVAAQYGISIALGSLTLIGFLQMQHMRDAALGYDPHGLVIVRDDAASISGLIAALRMAPNVSRVAASSNGPGVGGRNEEVLTLANGDALSIERVEIAEGFFETYRARLLAGVASTGVRRDEIIVNESARRALGIADARGAIGVSVHISGEARRIVGVVGDMRLGSLRERARPVYYVTTAQTPVVAARFVGVSDSAALGAVREVWRRHKPDAPIDIRTAEEAIAHGAVVDQRRNRVLAAFTWVGVLLASFGAYALSAYAAERSSREMAIRRVVGADGWSIAALHLRRALAPVFVGASVAAPIAYVLAERWLSGFDARVALTPLYILIVALAALPVAGLASVWEAAALAREAPSARLRSS